MENLYISIHFVPQIQSTFDWNIITNLLAAMFGAGIMWFVHWHQRRIQFYQKQLDELYGPIHAKKNNVKAITERRSEIDKIADEEWRKKCEKSPKRDSLDEEKEDEFAPYKAIIDKLNEEYSEKIRSLYREIESTLMEKWYLAEPNTQSFHKDIFKYNLQDWVLDGDMPPEVYSRLEILEKELDPFFENIEANVNKLKEKIHKKFWS